jgi:HSP20 family molecular chaperone IbpA
MQAERMKVAPVAATYADGEQHKLVVEFSIPGAPTGTIDLNILKDSAYSSAPARDIEYASAPALPQPVKPNKAEATCKHGLLRMELPFHDPMEGAMTGAGQTGRR